jgi:surface polysaccharide O-acyltransferase-like enzyme
LEQQFNNNQAVNRLFAIDFLKAISIIAVVSFHSIIVPKSTYQSSYYLLDIIFAPLRFCVPVFFTISFFLLQKSLINSSNQNKYELAKKRITRIVKPLLFWFSFVFLIRFRLNNFTSLIFYAFQGTIFAGAYYLNVLLQLIPVYTILIYPLFNRFKNILIIVCIQVAFFAIINILLFTNYQPDIILVLRKISRSFFAYWLVYMAFGAYFFQNWSRVVQISEKISHQIKIILLLLTGSLMICETYWLYQISGNSIQPFEYAIFSCILSVPVLFICFASITQDKLSVNMNKVVQLLSKYSLGIYCIQGVIHYILSVISHNLFNSYIFDLAEILIIKVIFSILILIFSLSLSILFDKIGFKAYVR